MPPEIGGDHFRSAAVFLTQSHPHQTQGSDLQAGTSLDQIYAKKFGQETPIPSMQLCIENVDQAGGCFYGYSCAYTDSISWASPSEPLPMIRDPRAVFDQLFGVGATPAARATRRRRDRSILDWVTESVGQLKTTIGTADRARLDDYLDGRARDRAPHPEGGGAQHERRSARTADRAQRRARFVRRARQADVRSAGGGAGGGRDACLRLQVEPRRVQPGLPEHRRHDRLPHRVASRRTARSASSTSRRSTPTTSG